MSWEFVTILLIVVCLFSSLLNALMFAQYR